MNILILNWRDPKNPASGGAEISLLEHAKFWAKKGAKITWFASSFENAPNKEKIYGIKILRKGSHYTVHLWAYLYYQKNRFGGPDIVIDSFHFLPFFTPLYIKTNKIIALINEPAKNAWFKNIFFPLSLIGYLIEPFFFFPYRQKSFITGSESIAKELIKYKIEKNKINVIQHGTHAIELTRLKEKNPTIIYLGQISPDKGIEDAIKAFTLIYQKVPQAKFWIVGKAVNKKYLTKIKNIVGKNNVANAVNFFGFVSEDKKNELLSRAWILIHPSVREGWGLNIIEANSMGTPAVGYNVTGLKDSIRNNQTGLLTNKNSQSLAEGIYKLITDKKLYLAMSAEGKKWAKNFNWDKSTKKSWSIISKSL